MGASRELSELASLVSVSSGNVGIGTSSPTQRLNVTGAGASITDAIIRISNPNTSAFSTSVLDLHANGVSRSQILGQQNGSSNGGFLIFNSADSSNTIQERMRIDSSGNVGIGTSSPSVSGIEVSRATGVSPTPVELRLTTTTNDSGWSTSNPWGRISFYSADASVGGAKVHASIQTTAQSSAGGNSNLDFFVTDAANGNLYRTLSFQGAGTNTTQTVFYSGGGTEAARIDSSGNLLVGQTALSATTVGFGVNPAGLVNIAQNNSTSGGTGIQIYSTAAAAFRFFVTMDGRVNATNTTILAISDARLKENIQDIDVGLDAVMALKPRKFDWKEGKGKDIKGDRGWIAQEFEQVFPEMVGTWRDEPPEGEEPYKSVGADLIPVLVKAMQEQQQMIETLQAKVAALEAR
jgi:hypothetical protein